MEIIGHQKTYNKKEKDISNIISSQSPKQKNQNRKLLSSGSGHRKNNYSTSNKISGWNG